MRGGYTEMRVIADHAHRRPGSGSRRIIFPELSCHVVASIPNPSWMEYMGWYDILWQDPLVPRNGMMAPPNRPGHGMAFRPELFTDCPYRDPA